MEDRGLASGTSQVLVIGGGIAGITCAVEAAEAGLNVALVERDAFLGGRVLRSNRYFPKMCPPTCGLELNFRRIQRNPRIKVYTMAEVIGISGSAPAFDVTVRLNPRHVGSDPAPTPAHFEAVTTQVPDPFNLGRTEVAALRVPHDMTFPPAAVLETDALTDAERTALAAVEPQGGIDLEEGPREIQLQVASIIVASGWSPYDAAKIEGLGYAEHKDVVLNVEMERMASSGGPTGGKILRPSDGAEPARVAFVQCAGSRDDEHLSYCSSVCCMASLKQARYVLEGLPEAQVTIFYRDVRTIGRHEGFHHDLLGNEKVSFVRGKVGRITQDGAALKVEVQETADGQPLADSFDLVVLAVGTVPNAPFEGIDGLDLETDEHGFLTGGSGDGGIHVVGCARRPGDVASSVRGATAAVLRAVRDTRRSS